MFNKFSFSKYKNLIITGILILNACSSSSFERAEALELEMLDVGQGLAFLIKGKNCTSFYDIGDSEAGIDTMLNNRNIKNLCSVIISHSHNDHAGSFSVLVRMLQNKEISINRVIYSNSLPYEWEALKSEGVEFKRVMRGDTIADFSPWITRIIFADSGLTDNASSMAIRINDSQNSFLFMGDLEEEQEKRLLELEPLLSATTVQIGHHGSKTSSSWNFLTTVQPEIALISAGKNNSYEHPNSETVNKLYLVLQDTTNLLRTDIHGNVKIEWLYEIGMWQTK